jgi:hypothetical protein
LKQDLRGQIHEQSAAFLAETGTLATVDAGFRQRFL